MVQDVWGNDNETSKMVTTIHKTCGTCKRFSPTPLKPVVSLPTVSDFGEELMMDLKEVKVGPYKYIFHMIDGFTRYTTSGFMTNKKPETIVNNMTTSWVSNYGRPKRCWLDVRGEFNKEAVRQLGEAIGCKMETGAAWQTV